MEEWIKYYNEAEDYSKTAFGAFKKVRLGNQVVYNLIGLAIENYLTSVCMKNNLLPEHSSIGSMLVLMKKHMDVPGNFIQEARFINRFMNFCSLDIFEEKEPSRPDLLRMLVFMAEIKAFSEKHIELQNAV